MRVRVKSFLSKDIVTMLVVAFSVAMMTKGCKLSEVPKENQGLLLNKLLC